MNAFSACGPFTKVAILNTIAGRVAEGLSLDSDETEIIKGTLAEACGFYENLSRAVTAAGPSLKAAAFDASALNSAQLIARFLPNSPIDLESMPDILMHLNVMRAFYQFQVERETR
ncbi:MAG: hypothetical protein UT33_C0005G0054 [Candidatus Peregrinibacteria bacterium GW2011_GWC2_39_14]|nr:MAG: hypothetical protein US92_C0001G0054 [Candidatus Peregrinibacteria bacterium GW2011_GWA2_38_36]KKR07110.1 MAG: hypothetical protein UT33_C0005G0054 [Candidatus Peregrinibacteria bacterium GW2011_GWC2_39_14]